jgi:hypothetical protein
VEADGANEPSGEIGTDRGVLMHERSKDPAQQPVLPARPVQFVDVVPVLTVDSAWHPGQGGWHQALERSQIARVHDVGTQTAQHLPQAHVRAPPVALIPGQRDDRDVWPVNLIPDIRGVRQAHDGMAVAVRRHVVDQFPQAGLQPPYGK